MASERNIKYLRTLGLNFHDWEGSDSFIKYYVIDHPENRNTETSLIDLIKNYGFATSGHASDTHGKYYPLKEYVQKYEVRESYNYSPHRADRSVEPGEISEDFLQGVNFNRSSDERPRVVYFGEESGDQPQYATHMGFESFRNILITDNARRIETTRDRFVYVKKAPERPFEAELLLDKLLLNGKLRKIEEQLERLGELKRSSITLSGKYLDKYARWKNELDEVVPTITEEIQNAVERYQINEQIADSDPSSPQNQIRQKLEKARSLLPSLIESVAPVNETLDKIHEALQRWDHEIRKVNIEDYRTTLLTSKRETDTMSTTSTTTNDLYQIYSRIDDQLNRLSRNISPDVDMLNSLGTSEAVNGDHLMRTIHNMIERVVHELYSGHVASLRNQIRDDLLSAATIFNRLPSSFRQARSRSIPSSAHQSGESKADTKEDDPDGSEEDDSSSSEEEPSRRVRPPSSQHDPPRRLEPTPLGLSETTSDTAAMSASTNPWDHLAANSRRRMGDMRAWDEEEGVEVTDMFEVAPEAEHADPGRAKIIGYKPIPDFSVETVPPGAAFYEITAEHLIGGYQFTYRLLAREDQIKGVEFVEVMEDEPKIGLNYQDVINDSGNQITYHGYADQDFSILFPPEASWYV